jgi:hypothetical protein
VNYNCTFDYNMKSLTVANEERTKKEMGGYDSTSGGSEMGDKGRGP